MSKIEYCLSQIIKYGLYALLLTPLALWPKALYPFLTSKFILFQVLVELVFGAWAILAIINPKYRPKTTPLMIALGSFFGISLVSALFGADFSRSFWGFGPRLTGLFGELHFFAWFLIMLGYFGSDKEKWSRYLNFSFFAAISMSLKCSFFVFPSCIGAYSR